MQSPGNHDRFGFTLRVLAAAGVWVFFHGPADAADLSSLQSGTTISSVNGSLWIPVQPVDPARSILIFQTRHRSQRPVASMLRGRIASPRTLEFARSTNEPSPLPISIQWYVASFSSGIKVQRGEAVQAATTITVPIDPVTTVHQAFVTWSKTPGPMSGWWSGDDPILGEMIDRGHLQFRADEAGADHLIWWQVVEFTNASEVHVQRGITSLLGDDRSTEIALWPPVDLTKTFVLAGFRASGWGGDAGARMIRARLADANTLAIDRSISGDFDFVSEIAWQVVELRDGSRVFRGTTHFPIGVARRTVPLSPPVDPDRAIAFASVQAGGGQNMGRSTNVGDGTIGSGSVTAALTGAEIQMERDHVASEADIAWFVVEFKFSPTPTDQPGPAR